MKKLIVPLLLSIFVFSCGEDSENEEISLSTQVIDGEVSGPFGDQTFLSACNSVQNGFSLSGGNVFYISTEGSDSNQGSQSAPFSTFQYALSRLSAGDTLYVKGGSYYQQISIPSSLNGSSSDYITIAPDPDNDENNPAIISGANCTDDFRLMTISGASYVRISNLTFKDSNGEYAAGILIEDSANHIIIDGCTFTNIEVPNPEVEDHVANGIICYGENADKSINNILLYDNSFSDMATGWGECISLVANCEYLNVIKNTVDNTGNIGIDVGGNYGYCSDPSLDFARYVYISENTVSNCQSAYGDTAYGIYADGGQHIQIRGNTVTSCSGGIESGAEEAQQSVNYATNDILIENNQVSLCSECAMAIGGYEADLGLVCNVKVTGNTFTDNADSEDGVIISLSKCNGVSITNNTFTQTSGEYSGEVLYYSLSQEYSQNVRVTGNTYNNLESADSSSGS